MRAFLNVTAVAGFLLIMSGLSACNTADGFGRDMEKAGESIQDTF
ncbi:MAG: hypothetical protein DHS20C02_15150 [Micavibrio sp.]|nr:MAG: hypothetical protein DHS20C02_15150 [Micavibrio sp.]